MEVIENQLLPETQNEVEGSPKHLNITLQEINTDDLPITPISNTIWSNNTVTPPNEYVEIGNDSNTGFPNTDNLLDISVPKPTLLGKEQAKKRLHAFSLSKQISLNSVSPLSKKKIITQPKFLLQPSESKFNENGEKTDEKFVLIKKPPRKSVNPNDKAKAVIEEIEEIKKIENAYLEALEQGWLDTRRRSRSRSKSRERSKRYTRKQHRRSRSADNNISRKPLEKVKYPRNWTEFKNKGLDYEELLKIKPKDYRYRDDECVDYRRQLLFQNPALPLRQLIVKCISGKQKSISADYVRCTTRLPKISYSVHEKVSHDCHLRQTVLNYVPKLYRELIKKIIENSTSTFNQEDETTTTTNRKWFPKTALSKLEDNTECKILETSLGLSFLQTYSDGDDQEKDTAPELIEVVNKPEVVENIGKDTKREEEKLGQKEISEKVLGSKKNKYHNEIKSRTKKKERTKDITKIEKRMKHHDKKYKENKVAKCKINETTNAKNSDKPHSKKSRSVSREIKISDKTKEVRLLKTVEEKLADVKRENSIVKSKEERLPNKAKEENILHKTKDENTRRPKEKLSTKNKDKVLDNTKTEKSSKKERKPSTKFKESKANDVRTKSYTEEIKKYRDTSPKIKSAKRIESKEKNKSDEKPKPLNNESPISEHHVEQTKCLAEKEFGTPDTEEYYSNWESDVELSGKRNSQSTSVNNSWPSNEYTVSLIESPITLSKSPPLNQQDKCKSEEAATKEKHKNKRSSARERSPLRERSPQRERSQIKERFPLRERSPLRARSPLRDRMVLRERSPIRERSPVRERGSMRERSPARERLPIRERSPARDRSPGRDRLPIRERSPGRDRSPGRERLPIRERSPLRDRSPGRERLPIRERSQARDRSPGRERVPIRERSPLRDRSPGRDRLPIRERSPLRDRSPGRERLPIRERSPLRERVPSPLRINKPKSHHSFPDELSPMPSYPPLMPENFSPFRNRCVEDRRRSRRSLERSPCSPVENYLEMPLNIRNTRSYSRNKWEEEQRLDISKYRRSPESLDNKMFALYNENQWERDDYLTIKTEEMRLEQERRTLIEERRKLEIERRQFEELERQRYYARMNEFEEERFSDRRSDSFKSENNEDNSYRVSRYRDIREPKSYSKENEMQVRRSPEDQRSHRRFSSEKSQDERLHGSFNWEDEQESKRRRKCRWSNIDEPDTKREHNKNEPSSVIKVEQKTYSKDKKVAKKNRWESSEEETEKKTNQVEVQKVKDTKDKKLNIQREENKTKSLTDNLHVPYRKSQIGKSIIADKPQRLENEYEKFMQALSSETAEEISDKDFKHSKQNVSKAKNKFNDKKHKNRRRSRSVSASSDEEIAQVLKKDVKIRKTKKKISSSSSSWSTSSESDSSTESSTLSSSSELSSSDEKHKNSQNSKSETVKIKTENFEYKEPKSISSNLKMGQLNSSKFDVETKTNEERREELTKTRNSSESLLHDGWDNKITTPSPNKGINLNIIDLSIPDFSLCEKPVTNIDIVKSLPKKTDIPLPVPSPKLPITSSSNDAVLIELDAIITSQIEPDCVIKNESEPIPSPVIYSTSVETIETHVIIKKEPSTPENNIVSIAQSQLETTPTKRNHIIPIKFLTPEIRKQANDTPNIIPLSSADTKDHLTNKSKPSEIKTGVNIDKNDIIETLPLTNRKRHFAMSCINLPTKKPLLDDSDHEDNSADFTDKFIRKEENVEEVSTTIETVKENVEFLEISLPEQNLEKKPEEHENKNIAVDNKEQETKPRSITPRRSRNLSPRRNSRSPHKYDSSRRKCKDASPRRWERGRSPRRFTRDSSTRRSRNESQRRYSVSPRRKDRRDHRSISPRHHDSKRHSPSPKRRHARDISPRRCRSKERSLSKERHGTIQETLQRIAGVDKYSNILRSSPASSPLHGFKRSVADSTISDEQLLQHNLEELSDTDHYKNPIALPRDSPKRMSLDERINRVLGLGDQKPKPISTTYSENAICDPYFDEYKQYYEQFSEKPIGYEQDIQEYRQPRKSENSNLKVLRVGNVLQVVPTEDISPKAPVQQNQVTNSTQKILQVGNVLQIVPTASLPEPAISPIKQPVPSTVSPKDALKDILNSEALLKQKAERRAEKDKRREERDTKRKEKEKKRKEREKRKLLKTKLQTEAMIKQALIQETEQVAIDESILENVNEPVTQAQWPPAPQIVVNSSYKPAGKGILCHGLRKLNNVDSESDMQLEICKRVTFSDGIIPGEGTSPSGGEELSSPPPASKSLPKEKRYIKTKIPKKIKVPKKKKVKVKVIRRQHAQGTEEDDEDEEDNLPPPPPPPGSPPPHIYPSRIKAVINNILPSVLVNIANTNYPPPPVYRSNLPHQSAHLLAHHGHNSVPPPHLQHHIPPPTHLHRPPPSCPPHHGGFNTGIPPSVISSMPQFRPNLQQHGHHQHPLQSPHYQHHH